MFLALATALASAASLALASLASLALADLSDAAGRRATEGDTWPEAVAALAAGSSLGCFGDGGCRGKRAANAFTRGRFAAGCGVSRSAMVDGRGGLPDLMAVADPGCRVGRRTALGAAWGRSCDSRTDNRSRAMLAKGRAAGFGVDKARGRIGSGNSARCLFALL